MSLRDALANPGFCEWARRQVHGVSIFKGPDGVLSDPYQLVDRMTLPDAEYLARFCRRSYATDQGLIPNANAALAARAEMAARLTRMWAAYQAGTYGRLEYLTEVIHELEVELTNPLSEFI